MGEGNLAFTGAYKDPVARLVLPTISQSRIQAQAFRMMSIGTANGNQTHASDIVRGLIRFLLERFADVEVCAEAANGHDTIDSALRRKPDLVIVDVIMPELNGIEAVSVVKQSLPGTKVIVFTMYGESVKSLAQDAGVDVVVPKPGRIVSSY